LSELNSTITAASHKPVVVLWRAAA